MRASESFKTEEKKRLRRWVVYIFALAVLTAAVFVLFFKNNISQVREQNRVYISNTALQTASRIDDVLENAEHSVATIAKLYGDTMERYRPDLNILQDIAEDSMCDYVEYVNNYGTNLTTDINVSDREYYQKGIAGQTGIDIIYNSHVSHSTLVVFYTPLYYQDEAVGVLLAGYREERMSEILEETYFGESYVSYLCERDGTVIACSATAAKVENVFDFFTQERLDDSERESLSAALDAQTSYMFSVNGDNGETDAILTPLESTDWCIVQIFPSSVAAQRIREINQGAIAALLCLALIFGSYLVVLVAAERARRKRLLQEKREAESVVDGINRLFARFVIVDLENNTYHYLKDYSNSPSNIERQGSYTEFAAYFQKKIIETAGDTRFEDVLEPEYFRTHMDADTPYLRYNFCLKRDTGVHWESGAFVCLARNARGEPTNILFAIQDITELHRSEEKKNLALRDAFRAAEDANEAKNEFLSRISHDMRTPMNAVMGMATIASMHLEEPDRIKDCLDKIRTSGQHLLSLINEMLDLSKIESGRINLSEKPFSLRVTLREVLDYLQPQMGAKDLRFVFPGNKIRHDRVCGDEQRLQRILTNILENAVEYTPAGGTITLSVSEQGSPNSQTSCYEFVCEDTGIGIAEELLNRVFDPFVCVEDSRIRQGQGIGLGLPIARQFAQLMGGDISAQSAPGKGSRFTIKVQLKVMPDTQEAEAEAPQPDLTDDLRFDGRRVLLVEDNELNAEIAVELLRLLGIETDIAGNGQCAVELLLQTDECPYDLILMDIQMPVMNGYEAARLIRASGRTDLMRVPIIAMTANTFRDDIDRAFASGMNAHLPKPVSHAQLAKTLQKWFDQDAQDANAKEASA